MGGYTLAYLAPGVGAGGEYASIYCPGGQIIRGAKYAGITDHDILPDDYAICKTRTSS